MACAGVLEPDRPHPATRGGRAGQPGVSWKSGTLRAAAEIRGALIDLASLQEPRIGPASHSTREGGPSSSLYGPGMPHGKPRMPRPLLSLLLSTSQYSHTLIHLSHTHTHSHSHTHSLSKRPDPARTVGWACARFLIIRPDPAHAGPGPTPVSRLHEARADPTREEEEEGGGGGRGIRRQEVGAVDAK